MKAPVPVKVIKLLHFHRSFRFVIHVSRVEQILEILRTICQSTQDEKCTTL